MLLKESIKTGDKIMFTVTLTINQKVSQFTGTFTLASSLSYY